MATDQSITIDKVEFSKSETKTAPREIIERFRSGTDPAALGFTAEEAQDLIDAADDPANARKKVLSVERITPGEVVPAQISEAEAIGLTLMARQTHYGKNFAKHGYTADVLKQAENGISSEGKQLREFFAREYHDNYPDLARLFREMFGIDLPQIPNYYPGLFEHAGKEREMDPFGGGLLPEGGFRAGFLKERKEHLAEPRLENAFSVWRNQVAQTEHWKAFAPMVRELRSVFGNVDVKNAIKGKFGTDLLNALERKIEAFENNGLRERSLGESLDGMFREFNRRQATLTLAWKTLTAAKNLILPTFNSFARIPAGGWMRSFSRIVQGKVDLKPIWNHPMIQRRVESGYSVEVRAAMASLFNGKPGFIRNWIARGLEIHGEADALGSTISTAVAYDYHYTQAKKAGLSDEAAREQALIEAEDVLNRTGQPIEMMDRSNLELGMSPLEKSGFMFATESRKATAFVISAIQQWKRGKMTKGEAAQVITAMWLASGIGSALLSAAWRDRTDDDDDEWLDWEHWNPIDIAAQTLLGPLSGIPLLNALASELQGFTGGPFKATGRAKGSIVHLFDGDKSEPVEKTVDRATAVLNGAALLIPQAEGLAIGANIFNQAFDLVDSLVPDTVSERGKKARAMSKFQR